MHFYISEHYQCLLRRALTKYITEITYNIDRMCTTHHTHWSVESVVERGATAPSLSSVCGRGRQGVETRTARVSAQDLEDSGASFAMV